MLTALDRARKEILTEKIRRRYFLGRLDPLPERARNMKDLERIERLSTSMQEWEMYLRRPESWLGALSPFAEDTYNHGRIEK